MTYYSGDTVRLKASFYNWSVALEDLSTEPTVKIYDADQTLLDTGTATRESTGVYYYDYTPADVGSYTYEFLHTGSGWTILRRGTFDVVFV